MLWTRYFCKIMHINNFICFHKRRGQPWLLSCLKTGCFLAVALRSASVLGTLVSLFLYEPEMNSCPSYSCSSSSLQDPGLGWSVAHLQTTLANYWAKPSLSTCLFVFICSLSLSKAFGISQQFNLVPRMSHGCSVCHFHCVLACFGRPSSVPQTCAWCCDQLVQLGSQMCWDEVQRLNLALNAPSHVSHCTLGAVRYQDTGKKHQMFSSSDLQFSLNLMAWQTKM